MRGPLALPLIITSISGTLPVQMEPAFSRLPEQFRSGASEEGGGDKSRAREKLREERATRVLEHVARIVNNHSDNPTATFEILSEFWRVRSDTRPVEERPMAKNITIASHPGKTWAGGLRKRYSYAGKLFLKEPEGPTWTADDARLVSATSNTPLTVGEVKLLALLSAGAAKLATPPELTNPANTFNLPDAVFDGLCAFRDRPGRSRSTWSLDEDGLLLFKHIVRSTNRIETPSDPSRTSLSIPSPPHTHTHTSRATEYRLVKIRSGLLARLSPPHANAYSSCVVYSGTA